MRLNQETKTMEEQEIKNEITQTPAPLGPSPLSLAMRMTTPTKLNTQIQHSEIQNNNIIYAQLSE